MKTVYVVEYTRSDFTREGTEQPTMASLKPVFKKGGHGCATACIGGDQGITLIIERETA